MNITTTVQPAQPAKRTPQLLALLRAVLALMLFVTGYVILTGGLQEAGIFWIYVYPAVAFFLGGRREGGWWVACLLVMAAGAIFLEASQTTATPYDVATLVQFAASLCVLSVGLYARQLFLERSAERVDEQTMRAKSEFVTLASHQLRTPVSAVAWISELLLSGDAGPLSKEQRKHVSDIYKSNQRMAALVSEMLVVSSLDLRSLPVVRQKTDLAALLGGVVRDQMHTHSLLGHKVTERYDSNLPKVECDPEIMKLILRNLVSNAFKYTPTGGGIAVAITVSHTKKIRAGSRGSVVITVQDTGYGIPKSFTANILSKFFRAQNVASKDTYGFRPPGVTLNHALERQ